MRIFSSPAFLFLGSRPQRDLQIIELKSKRFDLYCTIGFKTEEKIMKCPKLKLVLLSILGGSAIQAAELSGGQSKYEMPIINQDLVMYFVNKPSVKVEVSVEDATGRGERAIDFFLVEPHGSIQNIPTTLAAILPRSKFLELAINTLFKSGSEVLKISEALSDPSSRGAINGFIGITSKDLQLGK
jgi:hypothetical protein